MKTLPIAKLQDAKILIRVPNWIGDAVMCLPALRALRNALPAADLWLLARPWVLDLFPIAELRCRTIAYDIRGEHRGIRGRLRMASRLRREKFAAAILFQNAFDAAMLAALSGIPVRAGYSRQARGPLLTHPVQVPRAGEIPRHETYYYLELLRQLGLISQLPEAEDNSLRSVAPDFATAKQQLAGLFPRSHDLHSSPLLIGFGAGASFGTAKRWPADRYADLALRFEQELGAASVFFGSQEEGALIEALLPNAGGTAISLAGKTSLPDFIRLVPGCALYVTNDTGTMHIAAALGVPTLALFGPTDEHGTRPLGARVQVLTGEAECRPCKLRHCPIDHRCMTSISVNTVFEAARRLIEATGWHRQTGASRSTTTQGRL